jgi:hypothetical protein
VASAWAIWCQLWPLAEIGSRLGITRQAAQQRWGSPA